MVTIHQARAIPMTDMPRTLVLPLKRLYFEQIAKGEKPEEFRRVTPYWERRLEGKEFDVVELTLGYPPAGDPHRRLKRRWKGLRRIRLQHPHFGPEEVEVYAIDVSEALAHEAARTEPS